MSPWSTTFLQHTSLSPQGESAPVPPRSATSSAASIHSLSDCLLAELFNAIQRKDGSFTYAIVSKRWHEVAVDQQRFLAVRPKIVPVVELDLVKELSAFKSLTQVCLERDSVCSLSQRFLVGVAKACPNLRRLDIDKDADQRLSFDGASDEEDEKEPWMPSFVSSRPGFGAVPAVLSLIAAEQAQTQSTGVAPASGLGEKGQPHNASIVRLVDPSSFPRHAQILQGVEGLRHLEVHNIPMPDIASHIPLLSSFIYKSPNFGDLPPSLGSIINLKHLDLNCAATSLPESFRQLTGLEVLKLSLNATSIPAWIGGFRKLTELALKCLATEFPEQFWYLTGLLKLSIEAPLQEIPDGIANLQKLTNLSVDSGSFGQPLPLKPFLSTLTSLTYLSVSYHVPSFLELLPSLKNLQFLRLVLPSSREHTPELASVLAQLTNLRTFRVHNVEVPLLASAFNSMPALESLQIHDCLPEELERIVPSLRHVKSMDVYFALHSAPGSAGSGILDLGSLESIRDLRLCFNKLRGLSDNLSSSRHLKDLVIESTVLTSLPESFSSLSALESFKLGGGYLKSSFVSFNPSFSKLPKLKKLVLSSLNSLSTLPPSFSDMTSLQSLEIVSCSHLDSAFESLPVEVRRLKLESVKVGTGAAAWIGKLQKLRILELRFVYLQHLPDSIRELKELRQLRLADLNHLTRIPEFITVLPSLSELKIEYCSRLAYVPAALLHSPILKADKVSLRRVLRRQSKGFAEEAGQR